MLIRKLNDYESLLGPVTCNVGIRLKIPSVDDTASVLERAWKCCISDYEFLQARLVAREGDIGPLGQRYDLVRADLADQDMLFKVERRQSLAGEDLVRELQRVGTTDLNISRGTYFVSCFVDPFPTDGRSAVSMVVSLCHALSDGPGSLYVADSFLKHVCKLLDNAEEMPLNAAPQPAVDLQALILGEDYGAGTEGRSNDCFGGMDDISRALTEGADGASVDGIPLVVPEAMQQLPVESGFGKEERYIDAVSECITAAETEILRTRCRSHGATIQGALTIACLVARIRLLGLSLPRYAAVQVPMNCRSLTAIDKASCVCAAAGIWHTAVLREDDSLFALATDATEAVRTAMKNGQQREWLRRLFNSPAALPTFSFMESSVGVAPVQAAYGDVAVEELLFFGAALRGGRTNTAMATMLHAISFRGQLQIMFNFISPGVSREFGESSAKLIRSTLLAMARHPDPEKLTVSMVINEETNI